MKDILCVYCMVCKELCVYVMWYERNSLCVDKCGMEDILCVCYVVCNKSCVYDMWYVRNSAAYDL